MKKIISMALLVLLFAISFLVSCNRPVEQLGSNDYILVANLALRATMLQSCDTPAACSLLREIQEEAMHQSTQLLYSSPANTGGTCCCPCDSMAVYSDAAVVPTALTMVSSCPCPRYSDITFLAPVKSNTSIAIGDNKLSAEAMDGRMKNWEQFRLSKDVKMEDGRYIMRIQTDLFGKGMTTYTLPISLRDGLPFISKGRK